jgi:hypothetical protein
VETFLPEPHQYDAALVLASALAPALAPVLTLFFVLYSKKTQNLIVIFDFFHHIGKRIGVRAGARTGAALFCHATTTPT